MEDAPANPFALPPERMRELGYRVVDDIVQHWCELRDKPAMRVSSRPVLEEKLREPLPQTGAAFEDVMKTVTHAVFGSMGHLNHPRFFGFIPSPANFISVLADTLVAGYTPFTGTWLEGSGPAQIELITTDWLLDLFGIGRQGGGMFFSGGSMANLTGLAAARAANPEGRIFYCSDQTHSSLDRAAKLLGFRHDEMRRLRSDDRFRLDLRELRDAVAVDRRAGLKPLCVIANAGTTNTGAIDPLREIADFCKSEGLWLHADGAYGAAAMFSERGKPLLKGIERVDSLTLDPHKWLFQPYAIGSLLVRDHEILHRCFHVLPEYLKDTQTYGTEVNFCDYGPELTRPFRALKMWMSLKVFGAQAFGDAITRGFALAEFAEEVLRQSSTWRIVTPAQMGIVTFRCIRGTGDLDEQNRRIAQQNAEDGCSFMSTTELRGQTVLRMCTINPATTEDDIRMTIECLERCVP